MNRDRSSKYLLLLTGALFVGLTPYAHAASVATAVGTLIGGVTLGAVLLPMSLTAYLFGYIASWFVTIGGTLTNWSLDLNSQLLNSPIVQTGWVASRDLANLGFVLAIILIAFVTIVRYESYDSKKMLVRLISAALLVNFSLVIAGVFIDFTGITTNFFLSNATSGDLTSVGQELTSAFRAQTLFQQNNSESTIQNYVQGLSNDVNKKIVFLATETFVGVFTSLTAISLLTIAAMLYIRYIALTILLILAPLAWLMWIWPDLERYWHEWWSSFMKWAFFAPAVSFFIYLAIKIATDYASKTPSAIAIPVTGTDSLVNLVQNFGSIFGQMLAVLGILYGGLYAANRMGIAGAGFGIAMAGKVKGYVTGAPAVAGGYVMGGHGVGGLMNRASTAVTGKTVTENLRGVTGNRLLQSIPVVRTAMQEANKNLGAFDEKRIDDLMKHYNSLDRETRANSGVGGFADPVERAAWMASMAKNNQLKDAKTKLGESRYDSIAQETLKVGGRTISKELLSRDPELARFKVDPGASEWKGKSSSEIRAAQKLEVAKAYKDIAQEAVENISAAQFVENPENLAQIRTSFLVAFGEKRSHEDKELMMSKLGDQIKNLQSNVTTLSSEQRGLLNNLSAKLNFMAKSPSWTPYVTQDLLPFLKKGVRRTLEGIVEEEEETKNTKENTEK
ncbi:hypothetical protein KGO95_01525 [Patescibacteria group bacterium]|nr:hypothetical protein [Patescibacteria group bacterium]